MSRSRRLSRHVGSPGPSGAGRHDPPLSSRGELLNHRVGHFDAAKNSSVAALVDSFNQTGFQSRNLGRCYRILMRMLTDPERPLIMMGLAGAMIPGGMRKVVRDMVHYRVVDLLVSTGANLYHDVYEALGNRHYLAQHEVPDVELRRHRINRMFDVYADDRQFDVSDDYITEFAGGLEPRAYSTREFLYLLGRSLRDEDSIVATAARQGTPVFCPGISDSSIGIALAKHAHFRLREGGQPIRIDVIKDNLEIVDLKKQGGTSGVILVGGGVPKNYVQQIVPMAEVMKEAVAPHAYGIAITTDDPKWGGLSGCTFEESQSWGKYGAEAAFATVSSDATIALPLLFTAALEQRSLWHPRPPSPIHSP